MADNINVGELRKAVYALFSEAHSGNREAQRILELIRAGKATYAAITPYSELIGKLMSGALRETITDELVIEGFLDAAVANGVVAPAINRAYDVSASAAYDVQKIINQSAGISFNPVRAQIDTSRVQNLVGKLSGTEFIKVKWLLNEDVIGNISRSAVTDSIRQNAKFHKNAGMHAYLARYSKIGCCEWCDSVSGKFEYGEQPDGFWRIHKHCNCIIEYKPSHYSQADIISYVTGENGNMHKRTFGNKDDMIRELRDAGIRGKINIPPADVDVASIDFDNDHINRERGHNVTLDEARNFIKKATFSETVWGGQFERYYSYNGVAYLNKKKMQIRTAFKPEEYNPRIRKVMEVLRKYEK